MGTCKRLSTFNTHARFENEAEVRTPEGNTDINIQKENDTVFVRAFTLVTD